MLRFRGILFTALALFALGGAQRAGACGDYGCDSWGGLYNTGDYGLLSFGIDVSASLDFSSYGYGGYDSYGGGCGSIVSSCGGGYDLAGLYGGDWGLGGGYGGGYGLGGFDLLGGMGYGYSPYSGAYDLGGYGSGMGGYGNGFDIGCSLGYCNGGYLPSFDGGVFVGGGGMTTLPWMGPNQPMDPWLFPPTNYQPPTVMPWPQPNPQPPVFPPFNPPTLPPYGGCDGVIIPCPGGPPVRPTPPGPIYPPVFPPVIPPTFPTYVPPVFPTYVPPVFPTYVPPVFPTQVPPVFPTVVPFQPRIQNVPQAPVRYKVPRSPLAH